MTPLVLLLAASAANLQLPPVEQCAGDASFAAFRAGLVQAVKRRDSKTILAALDEEVLVDFGGGHGRAAFSKTWDLNRPEKSALWDRLGQILRLGCSLSGEVRILPSMAEQLEPDVDAYETVIALGVIAMRSAPVDDAAVVAKLHWHALTLGDPPDDPHWYAVSLSDGRSGFVKRGEVRSPLDYRITVERVGGGWAITNFVAGD